MLDKIKKLVKSRGLFYIGAYEWMNTGKYILFYGNKKTYKFVNLLNFDSYEDLEFQFNLNNKDFLKKKIREFYLRGETIDDMAAFCRLHRYTIIKYLNEIRIELGDENIDRRKRNKYKKNNKYYYDPD